MSAVQVSQNVRQSNMELLRIVAMFMILVYHTIYYVFYNYRGESPIFASMMTILHIGVPLFVLISGYFGIKPSVKGFLKLYLILLFYNLLFYGIRCSLGDVSFSFKTIAKLCFPFSVGGRWWFFKVYLMLYVMSPILNIFRNRGGGKLLVISGLISFYWGWFAQHPSLYDGKNVVNFIFLYMLGYRLRTWGVGKNISKKKARIQFVITYLAVAGSIGIALYLSSETLQNLLKRLCYGYNSPVLILMSVLFFLIFTTFDFKSKIVNWIGGSVFAVYCVHEGQYFYRKEWYDFFEEQYLTNSFTFPIVMIGACAILFILCIMLDKMRDMVTWPIINPADSLIQKCARTYGRKIQALKKRI